MLISRRKKFIFIHIYKTAGASIRDALISHAAPRWQRLITRILKSLNLPASRIDHQPLPAHVKTNEVIGYIGKENFKRYFSFAIIRNPWDWQVSQYKHMLKTPSHHQHNIIKNFKDFDEYIHWRCQEMYNFKRTIIITQMGSFL